MQCIVPVPAGKRQEGRFSACTLVQALNFGGIEIVWIESHRRHWEGRLDRLEGYIERMGC
jgi:hypothetical protein